MEYMGERATLRRSNMKDINEIVKIVSGLMAKNSSVDVDINDASIAAVVGELQKAKVRLELSRTHQIGDPFLYNFICFFVVLRPTHK